MKEPEYVLPFGLRVMSNEFFSDAGLMVRRQYLDARKPHMPGFIIGFVGGHGGDVYWVQQNDGSVAVYAWTEIDYLQWVPTRDQAKALERMP